MHQNCEKSFLRLNLYQSHPTRTLGRLLHSLEAFLCSRHYRQKHLDIPGEIVASLNFNSGLPYDPGGARGHCSVQVFTLSLISEVFILKGDPRALNVGGGEDGTISKGEGILL